MSATEQHVARCGCRYVPVMRNGELLWRLVSQCMACAVAGAR